MLSNENILELLEVQAVLPVTQKPETISFVAHLKKKLKPESFEHDALLVYGQNENTFDRYQAAQTHGGMAKYADKGGIPRATVRQIKHRAYNQLQTITNNLSSGEKEVYEPHD